MLTILHEFNKNIQHEQENYKNELSKYLKKIIPYKKIIFFDFTRRSNSKTGAYNLDGQRQPAERAHVDYTVNSGRKRAQEIIGKNYHNLVIKKKRLIQLNIWRPLSKKVLSSPLAFADSSSINKRDLIATDQRFPDRVGEIYHVAYNAKQKWFWLPEMTNDEFLIFKGWDSSNDKNVSKFTPHTSFIIKNQNAEKHPRESIEARLFLII